MASCVSASKTDEHPTKKHPLEQVPQGARGCPTFGSPRVKQYLVDVKLLGDPKTNNIEITLLEDLLYFSVYWLSLPGIAE